MDVQMDVYLKEIQYCEDITREKDNQLKATMVKSISLLWCLCLCLFRWKNIRVFAMTWKQKASLIKIETLSTEKKKMEEEVKLKQKQILEKDNEIEKIQRDSQQELLKLRADLELMKRDFTKKEKQILEQNEQLMQLLVQKDEQFSKMLRQKDEQFSEILIRNEGQFSELLRQKDEQLNQILEQKDAQLNQIPKQNGNIQDNNNNNNQNNIQDNSQDNVQEKADQDEKKDLSLDIPNQSSDSNVELLLYPFKYLKTFTGHTAPVCGIDYSTFDNGKLLCSGSGDKTVRVWDVETTKQIRSFNGHSHYVFFVAFSPYHYYNHHRTVICSSSADKTIRFWDMNADKDFQMLNGHAGGSIAFSSFNGGQYLCSGSYDKTIRLWDVETVKQSHIFTGHTRNVWCVKFSPLHSSGNDNDNNKSNSAGVFGGNGYTLCSGSHDSTVRVWDIETAKELLVFEGHEDWVRGVQYAPYQSGISGGANTILSGSEDKSVRLWDIRSKKEIQVFKGHTNGVTCVEYLHVGSCNDNEPEVNRANIVCSGSWDKTIRFWDVRANKQLYEIKGNNNDGGIYCFQFSPFEVKSDVKNKNILTLCYGSASGPIHVWG
ncbi:G-protein beta WD-40 repeats containing protein [Reticulomyxa filosa]|uniref:G-protein beta WD-40 repeats containing protein n=1 Tax=Reticulomyxa filosa TaxID=46433 RepID=X6NJ41_RETFI|nr:G-protein beta WD-40 repeats containing protein [Reticulomyxa filosa]|eukprot:ETO25903.1 G-protein beta WD-40 repeats containing protein [Reticulomyxa filosa]